MIDSDLKSKNTPTKQIEAVQANEHQKKGFESSPLFSGGEHGRSLV